MLKHWDNFIVLVVHPVKPFFRVMYHHNGAWVYTELRLFRKIALVTPELIAHYSIPVQKSFVGIDWKAMEKQGVTKDDFLRILNE